MKRNSILKRGMISLLLSALLIGSVPTNAFAEEVAAESEMTDEEAQAAAEAAQAALEKVTPSDIATNIDGKYLALTFPASEVPTGFSVRTIEYQGQSVQIAQMTCKSATIGAEGLTITLAYLTDSDGSNGEFYLCDTTENARMSDMIKIDGKDDSYIIVLDPGDNVVGPDGFTKHNLQWGKKSATAWSLPAETVSDEEDSDGSSADSSEASLFSVKAYAEEESGLLVGAGAELSGEDDGAAVPVDDPDSETEPAAHISGKSGEAAGGAEVNGDASEEKGDAAEASTEVDENAMLALEEIAHTNLSGLIQAQPKEFCLLYAVDESGNLGFYLYDITRGTYQRYVDIPHGESAVIIKYKRLSRSRLLIIVVLVIILVIMLFLFINMMLGKRGRGRDDDFSDDDEDDEDDEAAIRKRVTRKTRAGRTDREDRERLRREEKPVRRKKRESSRRSYEEDEMPVERNRAEDEVDWENMEVTAGIPTKKIRAATDEMTEIEERSASVRRKPSQDYDLDEDFDFEFLNIKKH